MTYPLRCKRCVRPFEAKRPHALFCSDRCRVNYWEENGTDPEQEAGQRVARPLTQKDRVYFALRDAGESGVRSDVFFKLHMPRAAARILELRAEGHQIEATREGKYTRYTLVGSSADTTPGGVTVAESPASSRSAPHVGTASSQETVLSLDDTRHQAPSCYDPYSDAA